MKTIKLEKSVKIILTFIAFGLFFNFLNYYIKPVNAAVDLYTTIVSEHKLTKEHIGFHHFQTMDILKNHITNEHNYILENIIDACN